MVWRIKLTQGRRGPDPESPGSPTCIFPVERRRIWPGAEGHTEVGVSESMSKANTVGHLGFSNQKFIRVVLVCHVLLESHVDVFDYSCK